jgi:hypothetical protein
MTHPSAEAKDTNSLPLPAPIRLVHAFREASESSKPGDDPSQEALAIEILLIAGDASFVTLSRLDDLTYQVLYGGECQGDSVDRNVVEEGYEAWLDAADFLVERMRKLESMAYESETFAKFWKARAEAVDRRRLDRQALRNDQLARLAGKLKTLQCASSDL